MKNVCDVIKQFSPGSNPNIYLAHKSRHDDIDNQIVDIFEKKGFFGVQVFNSYFPNFYFIFFVVQIDEAEMDENYKSKRVDIINFTYN